MGVKRDRGEPVSYEDGLEHVRQFVANNRSQSGNPSCLLMQEGDLFYIYECTSEPCYGYLRTYGVNSTRPMDHRPLDLPRDFPDGNPVVLGVPFYQKVFRSDYWNWWYGPRSPYRDLFADAELMEQTGVEEEHGVVPSLIQGIVFKDLNLDSTLLVSFLRANRYHGKQSDTIFNDLVAKFPKEDPHLLACSMHFIGSQGYPQLGYHEPKRYYNGDWVDLTSGTFYNRAAYNRPEVDFVFGHLSSENNFSKLLLNKFNGKYSLEGSLEFFKSMVEG